MGIGHKGRKRLEAMGGGGRHWDGRRWTRTQCCVCPAGHEVPWPFHCQRGRQQRGRRRGRGGRLQIKARVSYPSGGCTDWERRRINASRNCHIREDRRLSSYHRYFGNNSPRNCVYLSQNPDFHAYTQSYSRRAVASIHALHAKWLWLRIFLCTTPMTECQLSNKTLVQTDFQ
ncbi:hypothetical protein BC629DRAFT_797432 [Irpex lacteus]|nr:hypothetical protein BC629DRAFT_797432 [Irpex lacteus]